MSLICPTCKAYVYDHKDNAFPYHDHAGRILLESQEADRVNQKAIHDLKDYLDQANKKIAELRKEIKKLSTTDMHTVYSFEAGRKLGIIDTIDEVGRRVKDIAVEGHTYIGLYTLDCLLTDMLKQKDKL